MTNTMKLKNKKGFTLTELIVVIVIIGILAAVLIPSLTGYIEKAKISAAEQEAQPIADAYELWYIENGNKTTSATTFAAYVGSNGLNLLGSGTLTWNDTSKTFEASNGYVVTFTVDSSNRCSIEKGKTKK